MGDQQPARGNLLMLVTILWKKRGLQGVFSSSAAAAPLITPEFDGGVPAGDAQEPTVRARPTPATATLAQRRDHEAGAHAVYRNWCRACVAGRGRNDPHLMDPPSEHAVPTLAIDYTYLTRRPAEGEEGGMPILVSNCSATGKLSGHVVPSKGTAHDYSIEQCARVVENFWSQ